MIGRARARKVFATLGWILAGVFIAHVLAGGYVRAGESLIAGAVPATSREPATRIFATSRESVPANLTTEPPRYPLHRLSSGALALLDRGGNLIHRGVATKQPLQLEASLFSGLSPRIGPNISLVPDPEQLPGGMRAQAEPHIARDPNRPDVLLATFQEGRYAGPGAVTCGYAVSRDGGVSWTRQLIPSLTTNSGGEFFRATDPVAAIDSRGWMYLNTLAARDAFFDGSALIVSRSTNGGITFETPIQIASSAGSDELIDKNWIAINTFPGTPGFGRIVTAFTRFDFSSSPLLLSYSDDQGTTWSPFKYITPPSQDTQGAQPVFLPSGKLAVVYWNFNGSYIEVRTSTDAGDTFTFSNRVAFVTGYNAPELRDGEFLPSAAGNRTNDSLYVAYQGLYRGTEPRILFTMSTNAGQQWTAPVPISDNTPGSLVCNAAISASPDGRQLSVLFYDARRHSTNEFLLDCYLAYSVDGGLTWKPNIRLSEKPIDMRLAPLTSSGYMLGDYMGIAPADGPDVPAVAIFVDTRNGNPDVAIARASIASATSFTAWRAARFSLAEVRSEAAQPGADFDKDGTANLLEYTFGTNPRSVDAPLARPLIDPATRAFAMQRQVVADAFDIEFSWEFSQDLVNWTPVAPFYQRYSKSPESPVGLFTDLLDGTSGGQGFWRVNVHQVGGGSW